METNLEWRKYLLFAHKIMYSMKWSLGAEFWSVVLEWSKILEWQKYLLFAHKIVYSMEWGGVLEWIGVRFWRGKSRMECSCDVCMWSSFM